MHPRRLRERPLLGRQQKRNHKPFVLFPHAEVSRSSLTIARAIKMDKGAKRLLRCAIEAGDSNNSEQADVSTSESDKQWLSSAIDDLSGGHNKLVKRLQQCIAILNAALKDQSIDVSDLQEILEEMSDLCENIDLASDLHKIGGFPVILKYLHHEQNILKYCSADVIASVAQNNEYCQNALLEMSVLPTLLTMITKESNTSEEENVPQKCLHAVSCIIRQNTSALNAFIKADGFSFLVKALQVPNDKLKMRTMFLIRNLCTDNYDVHRYIHDMGFILSFMEVLGESQKPDLIEFVLETLNCLIVNYKPFRKECNSLREKLESSISRILLNKDLCDGHDEIITTCEQLRQHLNMATTVDEEER